MHIEVITRTLFLLEFIARWGLGWRYIFSPSFRRKVHSGWARQSAATVTMTIVFSIAAFVVLNGFLVLMGMWLYQGIVVPRLDHGVDR